MKKFLTSNWRRVMYSLAGLIILINLIFVIFTPPTVIEDFVDYGPNFSSDLIDRAGDIEGDSEVIDNASNRMSNETGISNDAAKGIIIFVILACIVLFLQNMIDGNQAAAKKK